MFRDKSLWIIGANSDIAVSFIKKHGKCFGKLILTSRQPEKMLYIAKAAGCDNAESFFLDLSDRQSIENFIANAPTPFGILFFAGRIEYSSESECNSIDNIIDTVTVNYTGPMIILENATEKMHKGKSGFVALVSSAGDVRGKYSNRFYVSSKRAVSTYLEGLMQKNEKHNVKTMVFKLGHVDTKMLKKITEYRTPIFVTTVEKSADYIFKTIQKNKSTVTYYRRIWKIISKIYSLIPLSFYKNLDM